MAEVPTVKSAHHQPVIKLFGNQVWDAIAAELADAAHICAAVAYIGAQAPELLPLGGGDVLIIDGSDRSLQNGTVSPAAIRTWLEAGVQVHTLSGLHAKVIVADMTDDASSIAIVGSANASASSRDHLAEACLATTENEVVEGARTLIHGWIAAAAIVDDQWLKRADELYRPPPRQPGRTAQPLTLDRARLWLGIAERSTAPVGPTVDQVAVDIADRFSTAEIGIWAVANEEVSVVQLGDTLILASARPGEQPHGRSHVQPPARVISIVPGASEFDAAVVYAYQDAPRKVTVARLREHLGEDFSYDAPLTRREVIDQTLALFGL